MSVTVDTSRLAPFLKGELSKTIRIATLLIEQKSKIAIQTGPKTGRQYRRRGRTHRASARGEAPATDTGFLVGSISSTFPTSTKGVVTVGADYAQILEEVLDRPFIQPAIDATIEALESGDVLRGL